MTEAVSRRSAMRLLGAAAVTAGCAAPHGGAALRTGTGPDPSPPPGPRRAAPPGPAAKPGSRP